jgi:hypothetical protein
MRLITRSRFRPARELDELEASGAADTALLDEAVRMASEPLEVAEEPAESLPEAAAIEPPAPAEPVESFIVRQALEAVAAAHQNSVELTRAAFTALGGFAQRPEPKTPDIHVHVPRHDLSVHVDAPEITLPASEITVEAPQPSPTEVQVDVHVPEQLPPQVTVAAAVPEVVVQTPTGPAPVVNVTVPNEIRTVPAPVETIAERDADDLLVRSVTRPIGDQA